MCRYVGATASGMSIISVGIPTGFTVENSDDIKNQSPDIKRVDVDSNSVIIYLDQVHRVVKFYFLTFVNGSCLTYHSLIILTLWPPVKQITMASYDYWLIVES